MNATPSFRSHTEDQPDPTATVDTPTVDLSSDRLPPVPARTVELDQVSSVTVSVLKVYLKEFDADMVHQRGIRRSMLGYQQQTETRHVKDLLGSDGMVPAKSLEAERQKILADLEQSQSTTRLFDGMRSVGLNADISIMKMDLSLLNQVYGNTHIYIVDNLPDLAGVEKLRVKAPEGSFTYKLSDKNHATSTRAYFLNRYDGVVDTVSLQAIVFLKAG